MARYVRVERPFEARAFDVLVPTFAPPTAASEILAREEARRPPSFY